MDNIFCFKSFDFFKVPIPISYENNYLYKTNIGAALTIISFLVIVIYTLLQISTLLDRSSFTVTTSESQDLKGKIDLSNTPIMFQLLDLLWNPVEYDPKLFTFTATYIEAIFHTINGEKKRITTLKNLEIERCDKLKKEFKALNEFSEYNLTKYMCIKPNQSLILYGSSYARSVLKSLGIRVAKCNNQSNECSDLDTINSLTEKRIFAFTYLGYTTNFTNINNGKIVQYKIYTNFIYLSKNLRKTYFYNFNKCKLNLFDNYFVTYKTEINYFSQEESSQDFAFIEDISRYSDELVRFHIIYSGYITEHTKDIKGIGPTFSYIMAAFNTVIIVSRIINDYYGNKILLSDLFKFFKNKNINSYTLNKYKSSKENDISKIELITKTPNINNYGIDVNGNFIFGGSKYLSQNNKSNPSTKFKEKQNNSHYRHSKKDYWKFCIYPYCLIKQNKQLYNIKDETCSIFSVENILELIKSLESLHSLKTEFYDQVIESKMVNSYSRVRGSNYYSRPKIEIARFSELINNK